jgi:hypothetical protein
MTDKPNPDSPQQDAPKESVSPASSLDLAHALDELVAARESAGFHGDTDGASPEMDGSAPVKSSAGRCPQLAAWPLLVSGEAQPFEADELLTHAAGCPACAEHSPQPRRRPLWLRNSPQLPHCLPRPTTGRGIWQPDWLQPATRRQTKAGRKHRRSIFGAAWPWPQPWFSPSAASLSGA